MRAIIPSACVKARLVPHAWLNRCAAMYDENESETERDDVLGS